jgi:shikimate kinase
MTDQGEGEGSDIATGSPDADPARSSQIVLIGLMGAGKSAIGRRLGAQLSLPFVDADAEIEAAAGKTISEIFRQHGEAAFRDGERSVISRLIADGRPKVLATGGGAFVDESLRELILEHGVSLWLKADLDILVSRTSRRDHRPILRQGDPRKILKRLMDERYPFYEMANVVVESNEGSPDETVARALQAIRQYLAGDRNAARQGADDDC